LLLFHFYQRPCFTQPVLPTHWTPSFGHLVLHCRNLQEFASSPNRAAIPDYSCYGSTRIDAIGLWVIDYGCGSAVKIDEISGEDGGFKIYGYWAVNCCQQLTFSI